MIIGALIPVFNAEQSIEKVLIDVSKYLGDQIIVINDGSTDSTRTLLKKYNTVVLSHSENRGKGAALKTGFAEMMRQGWDAIITLDADGQHNPKYIPEFIKEYKRKKADIIIGSRMNDINSMPPHRILSNWMTSALISKRIGQNIKDSQCGYRLISRKVIENIELNTSHYETETEIVIKSGLHGYLIDFIDIETIYNNETSSIRLGLDTWRFIKLYWSSFFL